MGAARWETERESLRRSAAEEFNCPVDPCVEDAVIGLRLLGYETVGSCEGHLWHPDEQGPTEPFIAIKTRKRPSRLGPGSAAMADPTMADVRERRYLARLIWEWNRPRARMLQEILDACAATSGRRLSISARADRYGITIERSDQRTTLTPELLQEVHDDLRRLDE